MANVFRGLNTKTAKIQAKPVVSCSRSPILNERQGSADQVRRHSRAVIGDLSNNVQDQRMTWKTNGLSNECSECDKHDYLKVQLLVHDCLKYDLPQATTASNMSASKCWKFGRRIIKKREFQKPKRIPSWRWLPRYKV
jgi:hypothetical protein